MASAKIGFNEDLLSEILSRLPVKPTCRFKCVSKLFNSIISRINRETCKRITGLFFNRSTFTTDITEYYIIPLYEFKKGTDVSSPISFKYANHEPLRITESCNGLLCCGTCESENKLLNYYVCNPTTLQFKKLPDPIHTKFSRDKYSLSLSGVFLAFDPRKSPHYKILCVYDPQGVYDSQSCYQMEMYSSETCQWRRVGDPFPAHCFFMPGIYWNGAINWLTCDSGDGWYFNVDEERSGKLPMLPLSNGWVQRYLLYFGESNDHLHLIESNDESTEQLNIYEMDKEYSGWFIRYYIDFEVVMDVCAFLKPGFGELFNVISVVSGGIDEDSYAVLYYWPGSAAIKYNLVTKSCNKIYDFGGEGPFTSWIDTFHYIESNCAV